MSQQTILTFNDPNQDQSKRYFRTARSINDYKSMTLHAHIYNKSDTYIGSTDKIAMGQWLFDSSAKKFVYANVTIPEGMERCFIEIGTNAADNCDASRRMRVDPGRIELTMDSKTVKLRNYGEPIPLIPKKDSGANDPKYIPDMIFGELLTSSHYDTNIIRYSSGTNGYGSTCVNIYSKSFIIRCGDAKNQQSYVGVWQNNMLEQVSSTVTPGHVMNPQATCYENLWLPKSPPYTGISFVEVEYTLDFYRFGYSEYPPEAFPLFARNTLDLGFASKVLVTIQGVEYDVRNITDFAALYFPKEVIDTAYIHYEWPNSQEPAAFNGLTKAQKKALINNPTSPDLIPIVELMALDTPDNAVCLSYVNGIMTKEGGVHTNEAYNSFGAYVLEKINSSQESGKKGKKGDKKDTINAPKLTMADLKSHVSIILNTRLPDPKFIGQTKHKLSSPKPTITIDPKSLGMIDRWNLTDRLLASLDAKMFRILKKGESSKRKNRVFIERNGFEEANNAGSAESSKCILYIVEGLSASTYPEKRISMSPGGKDYSGLFPLRGKVLNLLKASPLKIANNSEIKDLKEVIGIKEGVDYTLPGSADNLRYGLIIINTDADTDGVHIRALMIALFHSRYSSILKRGMVGYLLLFAVKLFDKNGNTIGRFPTVEQYNEWQRNNPNHSYKAAYFKGLGTSTNEDIKDDMSHASLIIGLYDEKAPATIDCAFGKINNRKEFIAECRKRTNIDDIICVTANELIKYRNLSDVINKDLTDYMVDALYRAIPSYKDGLKKAQRQAMWFLLGFWDYGKSNKEVMNVDRVGARAAEHVKYIHGPSSMSGVIIGMCDTFVGSNNLNPFYPGGQFGTRKMGGKNCSSDRYIKTKLEWWIEYVVNKDMVNLVEKCIVEGEEVEPFWIPMDVPLHIINGMQGMATGHSTFSPCHNVYDVIINLGARCRGEIPMPLKPAYKGFRGHIDIIERKKDVVSKLIVVDKSISTSLPLFTSNSKVDFSNLKIPVPSSFNPEAQVEQALQELLPGEEANHEELDEDGEEKENENVLLAKELAKCPLSMVTYGNFTIIAQYPDGRADVHITELPIGRWTHHYYNWLETLEKEKKIDSFRDNSPPEGVNFVIYKFKHEEGVNHKTLKLIKSYGMNNITLIDDKAYPKNYKVIDDALKEYYDNMIVMYEKLRIHEIKTREEKIIKLNTKRNFILRVIAGDIIILRQSKASIYASMERFGIPKEYLEKTKSSAYSTDELKNHDEKIAKIQSEIAHFHTLKPQNMWLERLGKFYSALIQNKYTM